MCSMYSSPVDSVKTNLLLSMLGEAERKEPETEMTTALPEVAERSSQCSPSTEFMMEEVSSSSVDFSSEVVSKDLRLGMMGGDGSNLSVDSLEEARSWVGG